MAPNPPFGASIDYALHAAAADVKLEILDDQGNLVRRYSSADRTSAPDPAKLQTAPEWSAARPVLSRAAGMHRFVWSLRYPAPPALAGSRRSRGEGVWAPPGNYTVALVVDGQRLTQPLVVAPDPRVQLPESAYLAQFALARQIEETRAPVAAALAEAESLSTKLSARRKAASGEIAMAIEAVQSQASEISDVIPSSGEGDAFWLLPRRTTSIRFLANALERLATAVDGADAAPTADALAGYAKLRPSAEAATAAWADFKSKELPALNERLKAAGEEPITLSRP